MDEATNKRIRQSLIGERGHAQKLIAEVGIEVVDTLLRKNKDYGSSVFKRPILAPKVESREAIQVRMSDKIERLVHILAQDEAPEVDEDARETFKDWAGYAILWLVRERMDEEEANSANGGV